MGKETSLSTSSLAVIDALNESLAHSLVPQNECVHEGVVKTGPYKESYTAFVHEI